MDIYADTIHSFLPFAGRRTSGLGTGGIGHTMADMSQDKMMVVRTGV